MTSPATPACKACGADIIEPGHPITDYDFGGVAYELHPGLCCECYDKEYSDTAAGGPTSEYIAPDAHTLYVSIHGHEPDLGAPAETVAAEESQ